ncbi:MAG: hypothetical protein ACRD3P_06840 [Terriglobales bacterium]
MTTKSMISIWFFVGCLLIVYGVLILLAGIRNYSATSTPDVVMQNLHLQIWWGIGLLILGTVYAVRFFPRRSK